MNFLKIREKLEKSEPLINIVYLCVFSVYYAYIFVGTTMIDDSFLVLPYRICTVFAMLIAGYRFLTIRNTDKIDFVFMAAALFITGGYLLVHHLKLYFIWALMLTGAKNVSFKQILKISLIIGTVIMLAALALSYAGVIEDIVVLNSRGSIQHSLGINYSTDCAAHVLFLMMIYCCLRKGNLKVYEYAVGIIISAAVFLATRARNNFLCMIILIVATVFYQYILCGIKYRNKNKYIAAAAIFLCVLFGILIICMTFKFNGDNTPFLNRIDKYLSYRLTMGKFAFDDYGVTLFGSEIPQSGSGRGGSGFYFFLDSSYVLVLLERGILMFLLMYAVTVKLIIKAYRNNIIYIAGIITLIALQCVIEHHWMDISYNVFLLMTFASLKEMRSDI